LFCVDDEDDTLKKFPTVAVSIVIVSLVLTSLWLVAAKTHHADALSQGRIWVVD